MKWKVRTYRICTWVHSTQKETLGDIACQTRPMAQPVVNTFPSPSPSQPFGIMFPGREHVEELTDPSPHPHRHYSNISPLLKTLIQAVF